MMASTEGGMDIEEVAAKTPGEDLHTRPIDPAGRLQRRSKARKLAFSLGLPKELGQQGGRRS